MPLHAMKTEARQALACLALLPRNEHSTACWEGVREQEGCTLIDGLGCWAAHGVCSAPGAAPTCSAGSSQPNFAGLLLHIFYGLSCYPCTYKLSRTLYHASRYSRKSLSGHNPAGSKKSWYPRAILPSFACRLHGCVRDDYCIEQMTEARHR